MPNEAVKTIICPKCFHESDQIVYACRTPECTRLDLAQPAADVNHSETGAPLCAECGGELSARLCPHCGFPLPRQETEAPNLPLLIIGASGCGKSNYLTVLIHRIRQEMCKVYNAALYPLGGDATMELYDQYYYRPLFVHGRCPVSTELENIEPLGYSLVFSGDRPAGRTCNINLYDSCGITFENERAVAQHNRGLPLSRGILLLIDPSQLPVAQEQLRAQGKPVLENDVGALLTRVIQIIRTSAGLGNLKKKIDIPIAVCLTKLDSVEQMLDPSSFVRQSARHMRQAALDKVDFEACNLEVQSIIESWAGKDLVNQMRTQFSTYGFFAFSSLGCQPNESMHVQRVSPHRVLDPLLWLLWKNNIISSR